jgi:hypothetical protein
MATILFFVTPIPSNIYLLIFFSVYLSLSFKNQIRQFAVIIVRDIMEFSKLNDKYIEIILLMGNH